MTSQAWSISPSQHWIGNDGNWSSFAINVGHPPKTLFVLPSTSGRSTWVVLPDGCKALEDPGNCDSQRGELFDPSLSNTAVRVGDPQKYYQLNFGPEAPLSSALPQDLNYSGSALPVLDTLGFGFQSNDAPELNGQLIVGYATKVPFIGLLGLSWANETIVDLQDVHLSVLGALRNISAIPSQYWGYTAGAHYRDVQGSLTLGGYDASRRNVENVLTVPMNPHDTNRTLSLQLMGVSLSGQSINMDPITVLIDSVVPEIWLPEVAYTQFEEAFDLVWNDTVKMYLVDDDLHQRLTDRDASVTFSLAAPAPNTQTRINITLPYAAFDLMVGYPLLEALYPNDTTTTLRYFPLKRASDDFEQYYLGRTFLQEA